MKRGFTLVELLAVVVILSMLAVLTGTAIVNITKKSKATLTETQKNLIIAAAKVWAADNVSRLPVLNNCSYVTVDELVGTGYLDNDVKDPSTGESMQENYAVKICGSNSSGESIAYNYSISTVEESNGNNALGTTYCTMTYGSVSTVGSVVSCGGESFYVVDSTTTTVDLLAVNNITPTLSNPMQSSSANNVLYASSIPFTYDTSNIVQYVNAYKTYLESTLGTTISNIGIPTAALVGTLGCSSSNQTCDDAPDWVRSTDYWINSSSESALAARAVKQHSTAQGFSYDSAYNKFEADAAIAGIRPLITIPKSYIES